LVDIISNSVSVGTSNRTSLFVVLSRRWFASWIQATRTSSRIRILMVENRSGRLKQKKIISFTTGVHNKSKHGVNFLMIPKEITKNIRTMLSKKKQYRHRQQKQCIATSENKQGNTRPKRRSSYLDIMPEARNITRIKT